jgi:hypothetical protein
MNPRLPAIVGNMNKIEVIVLLLGGSLLLTKAPAKIQITTRTPCL